MDYRLIIIKVDSRENNAVKVQDILTRYGCAIKVRLGLHDVPSNACSSTGLIILQVEGDQVPDLEEVLGQVKGISLQKIEI